MSILRIRSPRSNHRSLAAKAGAFGGFFLLASWRLLRVTRRGDIIVALTDPPLLGITAWLTARLRGARVVHWVQDIYPEIAVAVTGHRWLNVIRPLRDAAWRAAGQNVVLGSAMAEVVGRAGIESRRITVIPNWAPAGVFPLPNDHADVVRLRRAWQLEGRFVVAYSGNLGRVHDLRPVMAAATALRDDPRILIVFIGGGAQRTALENAVAQQKLENVRFLPAQPREQLSATLGVADVHLVTLRRGCERFVFPSKVYGIAAAERPMLFVGPPECELARLVTQNGLGRSVDSNRPDQLAQTIRELAGAANDTTAFTAAARRFASAHGAKAACEKWDTLLRALAASNHSGYTA